METRRGHGVDHGLTARAFRNNERLAGSYSRKSSRARSVDLPEIAVVAEPGVEAIGGTPFPRVRADNALQHPVFRNDLIAIPFSAIEIEKPVAREIAR